MKNGRALNVLLIEDNPSDVLLLQTALEADPVSSFALTHVERLAEGLKQLSDATFDIVLADLGLPDSSGLDTFEQLHRSMPSIPMVVFSGNDDEEQAIESVRAGAQDYLVKSLSGFDMAARTIRHAIERNKLQNTVRESEARFVKAFHSSPAAQTITRFADQKLLDVNESYSRLTGYTREQLIGHTADELHLWFNPVNRQNMIDALESEGRSRDIEVEFLTPAGKLLTLLGSAEIIELNGEPCVIATALDITERRQAEDALRAEQTRFSSLAATVPGAICTFHLHPDGTLNIPYASKAFDDVFGLALDDVSQNMDAIMNRVLPEDVKRLMNAVHESAQTLHPWREEYKYQHPIKGMIWLEGHSTPVREADGSVIWYGVTSDITERKQVEERLRESEQRFTALFRLNPIPVGITRAPDYRIVDVNDAWVSLTGYTREQVLGKTSTELGLLKPEILQQIRGMLETHDAISQYEISMHTCSGEERHVLISAESVELGGEVYFLNNLLDITERKKIEEERAQIHERLRMITTHIPGFVFQFLLTPDGKFSVPYVSAGIQELYEISPQQVQDDATAILNSVHPEDAERVRGKIMKSAEKLLPWHEENRIILPSGKTKWVEGHSSPQKEKDGSIIWYGFTQDITERKQAEQELSEARELLQKMFTTSPVAIALSRISDRAIVDINPAMEDLLGYSRAELVGNPSTNFDYWVDPLTRQRAFTDLLQGKTLHGLEFAFKTRAGVNGQALNYTEVFEQHGDTYFLSMFVDITERKRTEDALRVSEDRYRSLIENMNELIMEVDERGNFCYLSPNYIKLTGYSGESELNTPALKHVHPDDVPILLQTLANGMSENSQSLVYRVQTQSGDWRWIEASGRNYRTETGERRVISVARDVTERKEADEKLRESEERHRLISGLISDYVYKGTAFSDGTSETSWVSGAFEHITGYSLEEIKNFSNGFSALVLPEDLANVIRHQGQLFQEHALTVEYRIRRKDGETRWLRDYMQIVNADSGTNTFDLIGAVQDITERKQNEEALKESESRFSTAFFTSPVSQSIIRQGTNEIIEVNDACCSLFGYGRDELIGASTARLNLWQNPADRLSALDDIQRTGHLLPREAIIQTNSGETRAAIVAIEPISWKGMSCLISFVVDITDRKQAEEKLLRNEEVLRLFVTYSPASIAMFDRDMRYIIVSHRYLADYRLGNMDLIGKSHYEVFPEITERQKSIHRRCLTGDVERNDGHPFLRQDGTMDWVRWEIRPWYETNGEIGGIIFFSEVITERKHAEDALKKSEERYQNLFEESPLSLWEEDFSAVKVRLNELTSRGVEDMRGYLSARPEVVIELAGLVKIVNVNRAAVELMHASSKADMQKPLYDLIMLEEDFTGFIDELVNITLNKLDFSWDRPSQTLDGKPLVLTMFWSVPQGYEDTLSRVLVSAVNITERKQAEREAVYRQERLEKVIQLGKKIAAITDVDACLREIHQSVVHGLGFDRVGVFLYDPVANLIRGTYGTSRTGEMVENRWYVRPVEEWTDWQTALHNPKGMAFIEDYQAARQPAPDNEMYGVKQHLTLAAWAGEKPVALLTVDNIVSGKTISLVDQEALQFFAGYAGLAIENATLHTELESKVEQRTNEVRDLYDNAPAGYHSLDAKGCFIQVNQTELTWLGYAREEMIGHPISEFITENSQAIFRENFPLIKQRGWLRDLELEMVRKDGSILPILVNATAIKDTSGNYVMSRTTVFDNTFRRQAEESLQHANVELERALRMKDEFLASMSHELRTPLTGILGLSEALQYNTYGELTQKQKSIIGTIESNGRHLLELINDILDISKMEAGKLELEMLPCSLSDICQASLQLVKGMAHKKGQNVAFSMNPADILVKGDARRLKQIIVNLLSNAVKYSPEKAPIGLDVLADASTQTVRIEIWDKGMGISPDDMNRLFQPFVQLDSSLSRQQTGTGLGLALVQRLVDLHGGSVQVESAIGRGSRFIVTLPYLPGVTEQKDETSDLSSQINQSLIVEDSEIDADRLSRFLKNLGIRSTVQPTAAGVVEKVSALQPDVVLLDIKLPDGSGWDVLEKLKQNESTRDIPVVITSVVDDLERANRLGVAGYLVKPFTLEDLRLTLSRIPKPEGKPQGTALIVSQEVHLGTVMIVDDNETNILMIEDYLRSKNYDVESSRSALEFFSKVSDVRPDLVLMDIQMPDIDGLEATRRLRLLPNPELASVPVIAITALAMPGDRERCFEAGADEYLSKPIRLKELVSIIQKLLLDT
jgi:PAS domain S-box-containing protein